MKKLLAVILAMTMLLALVACGGGNETPSADPNQGNVENSAKESPDEYFYWNGTTIEALTDAGKEQKVLTIPAKCTALEVGAFEDATVLEEAYFANDQLQLVQATFSGCTNLKYVEITAAQTEIPDYCFNFCANLKEVTLPASITKIGVGAFFECKNLEKINLQNTAVQTVGEGAFRYCEKLEAVSFPATLREVGKYAFEICKGLKTLEFESGVTKIGERAFHQCVQLKKVVLPESLVELGEHALSYCDKLEKLYLPESLETFSVSSFAKTSLQEGVVILQVYVKKGSTADLKFDDYNDGLMERKYY